jgi:hypothetical protein
MMATVGSDRVTLLDCLHPWDSKVSQHWLSHARLIVARSYQRAQLFKLMEASQAGVPRRVSSVTAALGADTFLIKGMASGQENSGTGELIIECHQCRLGRIGARHAWYLHNSRMSLGKPGNMEGPNLAA